MSTPAPSKRPAGRPVEIPNAVRLSLFVNQESKQRAQARASEEGKGSFADAVRELLDAYADGRVRIVKGGRK